MRTPSFAKHSKLVQILEEDEQKGSRSHTPTAYFVSLREKLH